MAEHREVCAGCGQSFDPRMLSCIGRLCGRCLGIALNVSMVRPYKHDNEGDESVDVVVGMPSRGRSLRRRQQREREAARHKR